LLGNFNILSSYIIRLVNSILIKELSTIVVLKVTIKAIQ